MMTPMSPSFSRRTTGESGMAVPLFFAPEDRGRGCWREGQKIPAARPAAMVAPISSQRRRSAAPMVFGARIASGVCAWVQTISGGAIGAQPPAGGDAGDLPRGVFAVAAGADQRRVRPAVESFQRGIIGAVEEVLHHAGHRGEVFRRREDVSIRSSAHHPRPRRWRAADAR